MSSSAVRQQRLKEAGMCSQCTNPTVEGRSRCQKHLDKANATARRRNAERKYYGLCLRCPEKAQEGHVLCATCLENLRHRELNLDSEREKSRTKQQLRRNAGLCKWCEKPNAAGRALCEEHLRGEREKVRAYRAERKAKGLCWRCDDPVRPRGVLCQKHREEVTAKERAKALVVRAGPAVPGEVPPKVDSTPVLSKNDPSFGEVGSAKAMVPVENDGLGVDVPPVANVVDGNGIQLASGKNLVVEEPHTADVPSFVHNPIHVVQVLVHGTMV
jgi:hypothetical protein